MKLSFKEWGMILVSVVTYLYIGYGLDRANFLELIGCFSVLFGVYAYLLLPVIRREDTMTYRQVDQWVKISLLFRLLFIFAIPMLSDDYFRFLWDGNMLYHHLNPYLLRPDQVLELPEVASISTARELYNGMNSPRYYTVYPPIMQSVFGMAVAFFPTDLLGSIWLIRTVVFIAEAGTILLIRRLTERLGLSPAAVLIYALNPLVIVELTGNLHTEAIMIFFLILGLNMLWNDKWVVAALFFGASIGAKLIPLMFLPALVRKVGWKKAILSMCLVGIVVITLFFPFFSIDMIGNYLSSVDLYFRSFEFNASIYYVVRWLGFQFTGNNIIGTAGPLLSVITFLVIMALLLRKQTANRRGFFRSLLWAMSFYLLLTTTVHPWYLTTLILLAVFTKESQYVLLWSFLILLSYATYRQVDYVENLWLTGIEYTAVIGWWVIENSKVFKKNAVAIGGNV